MIVIYTCNSFLIIRIKYKFACNGSFFKKFFLVIKVLSIQLHYLYSGILIRMLSFY